MEAVLEKLEQELKTPPTPVRGRKTKVRLLLIFILAAIAAGGVWTYLHFKDRVSTDDAQVDGHIAPIAAKVSGNVAEILVDDNQRVKAGEVLVRIDPRDYAARVAQARGTLAMAEGQAHGANIGVPLTSATNEISTYGAEAQVAAASSDLLKNQLDYERSSSAELAYARANVETQRATFERAQADLERMKPLVARDEISKLQFDSYAAAARVAQGQLDAARLRSTRRVPPSTKAVRIANRWTSAPRRPLRRRPQSCKLAQTSRPASWS